MANVLLDLLRSLAVGAVADQARETPQGQSVENEYVKPVVTSLMDAIIPPAAASDASAIPQDLIPADVVMTPAQEQQVLQNASAYEGYPYREGGDAVGANILPIDSARQAQVTQMSPTQLPDMQMGQTPEERRDEVQDFVRMVGGRTQALMQDVPEEARQNPEVQKGAAAMATTEALAMKGMDMPDEPLDIAAMNEGQLMPADKVLTPDQEEFLARKYDAQDGGAPVVGPKDVKAGMYPNGKSEPDFFDKAGGFLSDMFNDEETMTRLALAFNSMRFQPDQGLATVLGKRLETLSETRGSSTTVAKLIEMGRKDLADLVSSGQLKPKEALTMAFKTPKTSYETMTYGEYGKKYGKAVPPGMENELINVSSQGKIEPFYDKPVSEALTGALAPQASERIEKVYSAAEKAEPSIRKLDETIGILEGGKVNTGQFARLKQARDKFIAEFGGPEAVERASNTELLEAFTGSEVFQIFDALGLGARGLDTPAEREFLLRVMTGKIDMTPEALLALAKRRRNEHLDAIEKYHKYSGGRAMKAYTQDYGVPEITVRRSDLEKNKFEGFSIGGQ